MSVLQVLIATAGAGASSTPPPPPPPSNTDFGWSGDQDSWGGFGTTLGNSTFSDPAPSNPTFTYPDGSYVGKTRDFTGTEWMSSINLGIGGAWVSNGTAISINYWFYPTANGVQLMSESDVPGALNSWHYSMLEINSNGTVSAKFWPGTTGTSSNAVALNKWNHIYFANDGAGNNTFQLNGIATTGFPTYTRETPGATSEYFIIGQSDTTNMGNTGRFQGKVGYLQISDYAAGSNYNNNWLRFNANNTGLTLGSNWTIEIIAELNPTIFWASMWGNESFNDNQGYVAYFSGNSANLNVGSPSGVDAYNVGSIGTKGYWAFTHISGEGIKMYRNGVLVTPNASDPSIQPTGGNGTYQLNIGSRHQNTGFGFSDPCPGVYHYTNVNTTSALDATAILASYTALQGTYGL